VIKQEEPCEGRLSSTVPWEREGVIPLRDPIRCKRKGRHNRQETNIKTDDKMPTLRKIKRAAMPTHKPTQIAAHLILPNRTQKPAHHPTSGHWKT